ncbi:MAG: DUF177 domain-containing protein [Firmicutes bacterium]|nr:DUF177 domain-containing protein [Candidatus Fermentithermobacillaceae bacterium]
MKIDLSEIIDEIGASTAFDERARFDPVVAGGSEVRFPEAVRARGVATNTGNGVYVEGNATGVVELECSRCLARFTQRFDVGFEALFVDAMVLEKAQDLKKKEDERTEKGRGTVSPRENEEEDEFRLEDALEADMCVYPLEGSMADISGAIVAEVTLSLPMKPLCRPDCRGICPVCGKNLNEGDCSCTPARTGPSLFGQKLLEALRPNREMGESRDESGENAGEGESKQTNRGANDERNKDTV